MHGATKDAINYVANVLLTEVNSVTDNPTIFPEEDKIISGGNFHGQPLAISYDFLAIALAELGNISERRVAQLIMGLRGLPEFLVANPGLNSGFMIPQYAAASMVSQNKMYCYAASSDSIVSSNGQEDHVSMGANAATKLFKIMDNLDHILAIELMNAAQGIEFRRPARTSPVLEKFLKDYRKAVQIIKDGGYATDSLYVQKICVIIEKYGLTRFDGGKMEKEIWYRVRKNWQDAESQVGAFKGLENAKKSADEHPGFSVFDENGKAVYSSVDKKQEEVFRPYLVRVEISDLNIRKKPGTDQEKVGKYTGVGCFTIVAEADGVGASKWGLLKAYEKERNGWISLDFVTRI